MSAPPAVTEAPVAGAPAPGMAEPPPAPPLAHRLAGAGWSALYIAVGIPLGAVYLAIVVAGLCMGLALVPILIGVPILLALIAGAWTIAALERAAANYLLDARIPPLQHQRGRRRGPVLQRLRQDVSTIATWKVGALLLLRLPAAAAALVVGIVPCALTVYLAILGVEGLAGVGSDRLVGPFTLGRPTALALLVLAVPAAIVSVGVLNGLGALLRGLARRLLSTPLPPGGAVREVLAESIGDRTLSIAYWLPERGQFVDEQGAPVTLPEPSSGRTWTAVEHGGQRIAALIHDEALDTGPELVQAAATAAALALENEQLKAALRARVAELRASRSRIVEAGDLARRRLERDLHDGAQQHLVALRIDLQLMRRYLPEEPASQALVDGALDKLQAALGELRELARGIHPAMLSERGLEHTLVALGERTTVPVDVQVDLEHRLPDPVEAAAYFVTAEALTNVTKYANASRASVAVRVQDGMVEVRISDDGVGGADPAGGSGLRGLQDRVAALDGTLLIESPPGGGTTLIATIPAGEAPSEA